MKRQTSTMPALAGKATRLGGRGYASVPFAVIVLAFATTARAATWTSPDGLATITADAITETAGTLSLSGSPITVAVTSGDAVVDAAVMVSGSLSADVADGASLTFPSMEGTLSRITKTGAGKLSVAGGVTATAATFNAGTLELADGAYLNLGGAELLLNGTAHTFRLLNGATLRCGRPRATSAANGANATFHSDGGIVRPTDDGTWIFANIATVTVGAGGLIIDTSDIPAGGYTYVWQYGKPATAPGVVVDGGLRIRGTNRQNFLRFHNNYPPCLAGGIVVEEGGVAALDDVTGAGSLSLSKSAVRVESGGELRMLGTMSRLGTVKDLALGETADDVTHLRFSASASAVLVVTNSLSVAGSVFVRFPDTFTSGACRFLRAPKGALNAATVSTFSLDPIHNGSVATFSVDDSNAEYDVLVATVTSSVVKIDPAASGSSTLTLKGKTLRPISGGTVANPVVGQANDGFVLDTPFDVEFTNTFQNAGYFLKTGAGKATLSYRGDIKLSGKAGNVNTYRNSDSPLIFAETGGMPTVDGTSVVSAGANVMDFNVLAGTLALATSGTVLHHGTDMLVGGNKVFLDSNGDPIPAAIELHDGTLALSRAFIGDVHAYRNEDGCMDKVPHNALVVTGGTMSVSTAFVVGNYNDRHHAGVDEYRQYGGTVTVPAPYFHVGRYRTSSDESYPAARQTLSRFAVHGGIFTNVGAGYFRVSDSGGDAELLFDGGTSTIGRLAISAQSNSTADTKTSIDLSGGTLAISNITLKSSFLGTASWRWNGTTFKPLVDSATATTSFEGPWATNAVDVGGAVFDLSGMEAGTAFRMAVPLAHAVALGETPDGGVHVADGPGCLVLAAANTFTGPLVVDGGTVRAEVAGAIPATATVIVNAGGVLDLCGQTVTVGALRGGGLITNGTLRVTGEISAESLTVESLVLASGATVSVPLANGSGSWVAGTFTVTDSFSAEGPVSLTMSDLGGGAVLPKDFAARIATLPAGSHLRLGASSGNCIPPHSRLALMPHPVSGGSIALDAVVVGERTLLIIR